MLESKSKKASIVGYMGYVPSSEGEAGQETSNGI
jgi:hypothetical protein